MTARGSGWSTAAASGEDGEVVERFGWDDQGATAAGSEEQRVAGREDGARRRAAQRGSKGGELCTVASSPAAGHGTRAEEEWKPRSGSD
ncbi:hypothetical protein E2562_025384 [Oryza meyeriana var. granulata]|uniref:DUF834 domain-containing protein n=1 Tax=Oryza meyeriana var. granulata TaxID=110450 RepID=A0A6G1DQM3_9ORYZ|nr:hypothetical protein E2562_025384 [Oryza meyeriana var. granulata]